jgi:hypothetical protein
MPTAAADPTVDAPDVPATVALPVAIELRGPHTDGVRGWVEGVLGWQPVEGTTADLVPAALRLVDVASTAVDGSRVPIPTVLLLGPEVPAPAAVEAALRLRPDVALAWPDDRERLREAVGAVLAAPRTPRPAGRVVRVGGSAGGTGTSTVALALAGLAAWSGARTLVAVGRTAPVGGVVAVPSAALASPDLWQRATVLPGVARGRAVRIVDQAPPSLPDPASGELEVAVLDVGVASDVDVLVARPDASGSEAAGATTAAVVVTVGEGRATADAVRRACGGRRRLTVPRSVRVERAGLHRRVPAGLPGSWLRALRPLVPVPGQEGPG